MKRAKYDDYEYHEKQIINDCEWISATKLYNYLNDDCLVDWMMLYYKNCLKEDTCNPFLQFIREQGVIYEKNVLKHIHTHVHPIITMSSLMKDSNTKKLIEYMTNGVPFIANVPFRNKKDKIRGIIDLLVRSDYINKLCPGSIEPEFEKEPCPKLDRPYHYIVVDIKYKTLPLKNSSNLLKNIENIPFYKCQTWLYTQAIGYIQGYTSRYAFLLGRRAFFQNKKHNELTLNCFEKMGKIDFRYDDRFVLKKTEDAIQYYKSVKINGGDWKVNPDFPTMYPNLKCTNTFSRIVAEKYKIANEIGDITMLWGCSSKHRQIAFSKNVFSWRDEKFNSKLIGVNGRFGVIIDKMVYVNKNADTIFSPDVIKNNIYNWKNESLDFFLDFENIVDIFNCDVPNQKKDEFIFMTGIYHKDEYKCFLLEEFPKDKAPEFEMLKNVVNYIKSKSDASPGIPVKIWYWSAEKIMLNRLLPFSNPNETEILNYLLFNSFDLMEIFKTEPIVIRDCFSFKLKDIMNALYKHKFVDFNIDSECNNGMTACILAFKEYKKIENVQRIHLQSLNPSHHNIVINSVYNNKIFQDLIKYNEFDTKALSELLKFIRKRM